MLTLAEVFWEKAKSSMSEKEKGMDKIKKPQIFLKSCLLIFRFQKVKLFSWRLATLMKPSYFRKKRYRLSPNIKSLRNGLKHSLLDCLEWTIWRLQVSILKKETHFWIYVKRYILHPHLLVESPIFFLVSSGACFWSYSWEKYRMQLLFIGWNWSQWSLLMFENINPTISFSKI